MALCKKKTDDLYLPAFVYLHSLGTTKFLGTHVEIYCGFINKTSAIKIVNVSSNLRVLTVKFINKGAIFDLFQF